MPLSSKSMGSGESPRAEEFIYPVAPSGATAESGAAVGTAPRWMGREETNPQASAQAAAGREQQSWLKGVEAGKAEARTEHEQQVTKLREEIIRALREFAVERDSYFHRAEEQMVRLTMAIARKILNREAQVDPLLLTGVLRVALEKIGSGTNIRLRAHPSDIQVWREYFSERRENFPVPELIGDPELESSRCILETDLGTTEIGLETQLQEIEHGFLDLLAQRPGAR
jgi:flagellar assembly protein FliH